MPTAVGRTTTVPGSTAGSGTSTTDISSGPCHTTAFTMGSLLYGVRTLQFTYKDGPRRGAVRALQLQGQADQQVLAGFYAVEVQSLQDQDVGAEQGVVGVELLVRERLDGEVVH